MTTTLDPAGLHAVLKRLEDEFGRTRTERWGDRTLDLDLIGFGDLEQDDPELTLPHPRAHERDFVLRPWLAVDPMPSSRDAGGSTSCSPNSAGARRDRTRPALLVVLAVASAIVALLVQLGLGASGCRSWCRSSRSR